jgi:hypothetical protein
VDVKNYFSISNLDTPPKATRRQTEGHVSCLYPCKKIFFHVLIFEGIDAAKENSQYSMDAE